MLAVLVCERRIYDQEEQGADAQAGQQGAGLPSLDRELWLLILTFIRRDQLGALCSGHPAAQVQGGNAGIDNRAGRR